MSKWNASPLRNLTACSHLKGLPRTRPIWATPVKEAQVANPKKKMKFVLAKNVDKPMVEKPKVEIPTVEKKDIGPKPKAKGKLLPKNQRRP